MNRLMKVASAVVLGLGLATSVQAQSALNQILDEGVLKVGTTGDWNPMSVRDPATNTYKGFDIDIMTELAKDMGVEVEFVPTDWKTLVNGVVAGKYHLTGSASISAPRMKVAGYSESYLSAEMFPFSMKDQADRFDGHDSINQANIKVATTLGTAFQGMAEEWYPNADIKLVEGPARGYQEVIAGRADIFITSNIEGATLAQKFDIVRVKNAEARSPAVIGMLMPQDDQVWINYVSNWVKMKKARGFFEVTKAKWGL